MAGRDRGRLHHLAALVLAGTVALLWWQTALILPGDLGAWRPGPLQGQLVYDLHEIDGVLHAAAHTGLFAIGAGETAPEEPFGDLPTPVVGLAGDGRMVLAATHDGVYRLRPGSGVTRDGLEGMRVNDLAHERGRWLAATDDGAYERAEGGGWVRRWPAQEEASPVLTVAAWRDGLLVGTRDGIFRVDGASGHAEHVWEGTIVRALVPDDREPDGGRIWAGVLEGDILLASSDDGRTWTPAGSGIRLLSAQDVRSDPTDPERLVVGGTGVDDGEIIGGVMTSVDGGATWQSEPNRLSNTHVYRLRSDRDGLVLGIGWPFTDRISEVALPVAVTRYRAATNGAGVYTYAEPPAILRVLAEVQPVVRVVEPLLVGGILLALVWRFARIGRARPRSESAA